MFDRCFSPGTVRARVVVMACLTLVSAGALASEIVLDDLIDPEVQTWDGLPLPFTVPDTFYTDSDGNVIGPDVKYHDSNRFLSTTGGVVGGLISVTLASPVDAAGVDVVQHTGGSFDVVFLDSFGAELGRIVRGTVGTVSLEEFFGWRAEAGRSIAVIEIRKTNDSGSRVAVATLYTEADFFSLPAPGLQWMLGLALVGMLAARAATRRART